MLFKFSRWSQKIAEKAEGYTTGLPFGLFETIYVAPYIANALVIFLEYLPHVAVTDFHNCTAVELWALLLMST